MLSQEEAEGIVQRVLDNLSDPGLRVEVAKLLRETMKKRYGQEDKSVHR